MFYIMLNYPQESHLIGYLITLGSTLLGTLVGGSITYFITIHLKKKDIYNNAYSSAILIRSWLIEQLSDIENLKKRLEKRKEVITDLNIQEIASNPNDKNREKLITVMQTMDLKEKTVLYDLNFDLIKNLSLVRKDLNKYEVTLQSLSSALNIRDQLKEVKATLILTKDKFFQNEKLYEENGEEGFNLFVQKVQSYIQAVSPTINDHITNAEKLSDMMKQILISFQKNVCSQLHIKPIELGKPTSMEDIINESLK